MSEMNRRQMLQTAGVAAAGLVFAGQSRAAEAGEFELPKLPYAYDALEPHIDAETMHLHHDFHHRAYVDNLNKALKGHPELFRKRLPTLLRDLDQLPESIRTAVQNNGGGDANHTMFWQIMKRNGGGQPGGALARAIDQAFGSFDKFQQQLSDAAIKRFGSGWGWLVHANGRLEVTSSANQDSPYMHAGHHPIMGIDVWEHAYYLKYRNKRADYVKAWWHTVNWDHVAERFDQALKHG
jgi:Fe-Mn family superoxide dismutase